MSHIAFVLKGYPRLSETFIAQEIYMLEQKGYKIIIFSMRAGREKIRQPIVDMIQAPVVYVPEYVWPDWKSFLQQNIKAFLDFPFSYSKNLISALFKSLVMRDDSPIKRFLQAGWYIGHEKIGYGGPIHHLHSHFIHAPTEMTVWIAKITGLTYSISAHAKDIYTISDRDLIERINGSRFLMTCTDYNCRHLRAIHGIDGKKVNLVYHGINTALFSPSQQPTLDSQNIKMMTIGRLVEKKGYPDLLQALKILKDKNYRFQYEIYGSGELKDNLTAQIKDLNLQDMVVLKGHATQTQLIERMLQKGLYLNASYTTESGDRDGIPNTLAEAMAMELPVVATTVSGIPELIENEKHGLLVEPRDVQGLALAIERYILHPELADKLGKAGRERVQSIFESRDCISACDRLMQTYKEARS